jgi:photosystem II stability/assembly factor-like uncharacterized protein
MKNIFTRKAIVGSLVAGLALVSSLAEAHFGSRGPFGGTVTTSIVVKTQNQSADSIVFVGTANGGVYSTSNLTSWTARPVGLKSGKITALAHTGKLLIAGTADSGVFVFTGFTGTDRFWRKKNIGLTNLKITALVAVDDNTIFAGTNGGGVFKSTDKGENWVAVNNDNLHHLEITGLAKKGNRVFVLGEGVWATDDLGATWFDYNDDNTRHIDGSNEISYNETTNELFVVNNDGVFKTTVNADTISSYSIATTGLPSGIVINGISNNGANWYLSTNQGVYTSPSNAISWTSMNAGLTTLNINTVAPIGTTLIAGSTQIGIFSVKSPATTWSLFNNGFNNIKTNAMITSDSVAIVANEFGVFVSRNIIAPTTSIYFKPYVKYNTGLKDSLNVTDLCFADFCILASTKNEGIFFSPDTCKTWMQINNGLESLNIIKVFCEKGVKYAIAASGDIYTSALHSSDWVKITYNLGVLNAQVSNLSFFSDKILATTRTHGVFVKSLTGTTWSAQNTDLSNLDVTSSTVWLNKILIGTNGNGVFVSDTASISWNKTLTRPVGAHTDSVDNQYNAEYIQAMLTNAGFVFASYKGGLFATYDGGKTWVPGGNQFNIPTYSNYNKISIAAGRVFVTTDNNSIYSNALSELPSILTAIENEYVTASVAVCPNPNNGKFTVADDVTEISIYDLSGKLLNTFVSTNVTVEYPKGIYILKAKTSKGLATQKLVIE